MKHGMVASLTVLLAAGLAWGQSTTLPGMPPRNGDLYLPQNGQQKDDKHKDEQHKDEQHKDDKHKDEQHKDEHKDEHKEHEEHEPEEHEGHEVERHPYRLWARADYLLWWIKEAGLPPVASTGSLNDKLPGALGQPGTGLVYGGGPQTQNPTRNGARFTLGCWLDDEMECGVEVAYWFLGSHAEGGTFSGDATIGSRIVARPFFNTQTNAEDSELVAYPGLLRGALTVHSSTFLQGGEVNATWLITECEHYRIDLLAGLRFMQFTDDLDISEISDVQAGSPTLAGKNVTVHDHFGTNNYFYGGQLGVRAEFKHHEWFLRTTCKLALGDNNQDVSINGATRITSADGTVKNYNGGLLALPSNSGAHSRDTLSFVPEVGVDVGYEFSHHVRFSVGYSYLYWNDVARAANQIDRAVNITQVPSSALFSTGGAQNKPGFAFDTKDFWAQGVSLQLEFRY